MAYVDNDGRFPDGSAVRVRAPAPGADEHDRKTWPLLPAAEDTPEDRLRYPEVYCDSSEIMVVRESDRQT
jgi:hypothetical protein